MNAAPDTLDGCEWDHVGKATVGHTLRSTTSSRLPGKAIEGVVAFNVVRVITCSDCGHLKYEHVVIGHGHHWSGEKRVDCIGRELVLGARGQLEMKDNA